jgi:hypothetical protein
LIEIGFYMTNCLFIFLPAQSFGFRSGSKLVYPEPVEGNQKWHLSKSVLLRARLQLKMLLPSTRFGILGLYVNQRFECLPSQLIAPLIKLPTLWYGAGLRRICYPIRNTWSCSLQGALHLDRLFVGSFQDTAPQRKGPLPTTVCSILHQGSLLRYY